LALIRAKGYAATSVADLCEAAGVTKGAFFHHFPSKDALAVAAAEHWTRMTGALFAAAPYHAPADPLDRLLAYVDFRAALLKGAVPEFTCLAGTMLQEAYDTHPDICAACAASITGHAATLEADIAEAMRTRGIVTDWTAGSLALHTQAVFQGAFILAKAKGGPEIAAESIAHLRRYITLLFKADQPRETPTMTKTTSAPDGLHSLTPHLVCAGATAAIEFYKKAFGAEEMVRLPGPGGKLMHARLSINGSSVMLVDEMPDWRSRSPKTLKGTPVTIHLVVDDVDAATARAVAAGATVVMPVADQFWGDRYGIVEDPFGHRWSLATPQKAMTPDEIIAAARTVMPM
jgi:TetR/AcrR family transcriptional repressor of nem operon